MGKTITAVSPLNSTPIMDEATARAKFVDDFMTKMTGKPFDLKVSGYKIALYLPMDEEKSAGGIIKLKSTRENEVLKANCGFCVAHGPDAYADKTRYPSGPWCMPGDWVVFQRYDTTAALVGYRGHHIAFIPDDRIDAVAPDRMDITEILKRDLM
jgi:co-chaperonin GroES (HSP10)